jgi:hypothetical protein
MEDHKEWFKSLDPSVQRAAFYALALFLSLAIMSMSTCAAVEAHARFDAKKSFFSGK